MNTIKKELIEHIELGYDFGATVDLGNGWSPYHVTLPPRWRKGVIALCFDEDQF